MPQTTTVSEFSPRIRRDFSKIPHVVEIPNLLEIQKESFERFLQTDVEMEKRENVGLQAVFNSVFPIKDFNDTASLEFVGYTLEQPKYDVQECLQRGMTYATPFKVTIRLVAWDEAAGSQTIRDVKEQEVYFGEIPIMTDNGTFIINGTERVIVSQLHRSPGIFFDTSLSTTVSAAGKKLYSCRIIPHRGSWLDVDFDHKDLIYARIDRRRKIHVTVLLRALGYTPEELLGIFYTPEDIRVDGEKYEKNTLFMRDGYPAKRPWYPLASDLYQEIAEFGMHLLGRAGLVREDAAGLPTEDMLHDYLWSLQFTISGGTSQIQRNIIGERILGLPR